MLRVDQLYFLGAQIERLLQEANGLSHCERINLSGEFIMAACSGAELALLQWARNFVPTLFRLFDFVCDV